MEGRQSWLRYASAPFCCDPALLADSCRRTLLADLPRALTSLSPFQIPHVSLVYLLLPSTDGEGLPFKAVDAREREREAARLAGELSEAQAQLAAANK
jgi:hypothetical protein